MFEYQRCLLGFFFLFFNFMYFYVPRLLLENKTQPLRLRTNVLLIFY